jgi:hypothetical protein
MFKEYSLMVKHKASTFKFSVRNRVLLFWPPTVLTDIYQCEARSATRGGDLLTRALKINIIKRYNVFLRLWSKWFTLWLQILSQRFDSSIIFFRQKKKELINLIGRGLLCHRSRCRFKSVLVRYFRLEIKANWAISFSLYKSFSL